jgi:hypothetical protein
VPEFLVVFAQSIGFRLLDLIHAVAAHVADRDSGMFGILRRNLG